MVGRRVVVAAGVGDSSVGAGGVGALLAVAAAVLDTIGGGDDVGSIVETGPSRACVA